MTIKYITLYLMLAMASAAVYADDMTDGARPRACASPACQIYETSDPIHAAQIVEQSQMEAAQRHERELKARQDAEQREFEISFNRLVTAVAGFAKQYNEGKGIVWPQREADELREAMRGLQSHEKSSIGSEDSKKRSKSPAAWSLR